MAGMGKKGWESEEQTCGAWAALRCLTFNVDKSFWRRTLKKYLSCEVKDVTWHLVISKCTCSIVQRR